MFHYSVAARRVQVQRSSPLHVTWSDLTWQV